MAASGTVETHRSTVPVDVATGKRLRLWSRVWRYLLVVGLALFLLGFTIVELEGRAGDVTVATGLTDNDDALIFLDLVAGLLAIALLPLRRRLPVVVSVATALCMSVSAAAAAPAALATVSMATARRPWRIAVTGVPWLVSGVMYERVVMPSGLPMWSVVLVVGIGYATCAATGMYIGARRQLVATLHERAVTAERERALQLEAAQAAERTRIAREMHDVLAHRISLVAMHAGALAYRDDLSRDEAAETAGVIQRNARLALTELREVLGVLRGGDGAVEPPQPTLADLPVLLDEARDAGADLTIDGLAVHELSSLPAVVSRTAYRILQEALTNARKHAPGAPVRVLLGGRPGGLLTLEVRNRPGPAPQTGTGPGMGLPGLAERAELAGGTLEAGVGPDGEFVVAAWLPWEPKGDAQ